MQSYAIIAGAVAAVVSPALAYLAAARRLSGRVATTSADELWAESRALRDDYRSQLSETQGRQAKLEERVADLEKRNTDLARENVELRRDAAEAERTIATLEARVGELERENTELKAHVAALEEATHGSTP